jgi:hypothetical protein
MYLVPAFCFGQSRSMSLLPQLLDRVPTILRGVADVLHGRQLRCPAAAGTDYAHRAPLEHMHPDTHYEGSAVDAWQPCLVIPPRPHDWQGQTEVGRRANWPYFGAQAANRLADQTLRQHHCLRSQLATAIAPFRMTCEAHFRRVRCRNAT